MPRAILWIFFALVISAGARAAALSDLSDADTAKGLKEALSQAAVAAVTRLGKHNGYLGDTRVKIPLPEGLRQVERLMRTFGAGHHADELIVAMNRAAEAAVPEARGVLLDAVKKMTVEDAKRIVTGGDDAATRYFRSHTETALHAKFLPIIARNTQKVKLAEKYNRFAGSAQKHGLLGQEDVRLEQYVTRKALDGLYFMMAEEERAIRKDPIGRSGYWLKKVFGATF